MKYHQIKRASEPSGLGEAEQVVAHRLTERILRVGEELFFRTDMVGELIAEQTESFAPRKASNKREERSY